MSGNFQAHQYDCTVGGVCGHFVQVCISTTASTIEVCFGWSWTPPYKYLAPPGRFWVKWKHTLWPSGDMAPGKEGVLFPFSAGPPSPAPDFTRTSPLPLSRRPPSPISEVGSLAPSGLGLPEGARGAEREEEPRDGLTSASFPGPALQSRLGVLRGRRGQSPETGWCLLPGPRSAGQEAPVLGAPTSGPP